MYGSWREVNVLFLIPSRAGIFLPPPSTEGTVLLPPLYKESAMIRNWDRDRLLSELFYIYLEI